MNILDTITLLKAGYSKKEIEAMKAEQVREPEGAQPAPSVVDKPAGEAAPAPAEPSMPEEDPRIKELEDQVRALQAKVIQLSAVPTAPDNTDPIMDIAKSLINGGK